MNEAWGKSQALYPTELQAHIFSFHSFFDGVPMWNEMEHEVKVRRSIRLSGIYPEPVEGGAIAKNYIRFTISCLFFLVL
jgi:hypothetical protein